jgi:transcriptional regulator with XRE-family HTH domain
MTNINQNERTIEEIANSIRAIRKQKGLTLKQVEIKSAGVWKAVVIGSYERCDRALSLKKAIALASFYQVPLDQLLGLEQPMQIQPSGGLGKITVDIRRISALQDGNPIAVAICAFLALICAKRRDWNGEVLSLRQSDLETLALLTNQNESQMTNWLKQNSLLIQR